MGIKELLPLVANACTETDASSLLARTLDAGRPPRVAVDAACWLHRSLTGCTEQLMNGAHTDFPVQYCMRLVRLLLGYGVHVVLVFDGQPLPAKQQTDGSRQRRRAEQRERARKLLMAGDAAGARDAYRKGAQVTWHMKHALMLACERHRSTGSDREPARLEWIVAPHEADAQLAYLAHRRMADYVLTEDSDLIVYGVDKVIFKLESSGRCVLYDRSRLHRCNLFRSPSAFDLTKPDSEREKGESEFGKLRRACILSGCDYLPEGLAGVGLAKARSFFARCDEADMHKALPRLPRYLNMPSLRVTADFVRSFVDAELVFLHQIVYCPARRRRVPLNEFTENSQYSAHYGILDEANATSLACGLADPTAGAEPRMQWLQPWFESPPAWSIWYGGAPFARRSSAPAVPPAASGATASTAFDLAARPVRSAPALVAHRENVPVASATGSRSGGTPRPSAKRRCTSPVNPCRRQLIDAEKQEAAAGSPSGWARLDLAKIYGVRPGVAMRLVNGAVLVPDGEEGGEEESGDEQRPVQRATSAAASKPFRNPFKGNRNVKRSPAERAADTESSSCEPEGDTSPLFRAVRQRRPQLGHLARAPVPRPAKCAPLGELQHGGAAARPSLADRFAYKGK